MRQQILDTLAVIAVVLLIGFFYWWLGEGEVHYQIRQVEPIKRWEFIEV